MCVCLSGAYIASSVCASVCVCVCVDGTGHTVIRFIPICTMYIKFLCSPYTHAHTSYLFYDGGLVLQEHSSGVMAKRGQTDSPEISSLHKPGLEPGHIYTPPRARRNVRVMCAYIWRWEMMANFDALFKKRSS